MNVREPPTARTQTLVTSTSAPAAGVGEIPTHVNVSAVSNPSELFPNAALMGEFFSRLGKFFSNSVANVANAACADNLSNMGSITVVSAVPDVSMPNVNLVSSSANVSMVTGLPAVTLVTYLPTVSVMNIVPTSSNFANVANVWSGDAGSNFLPSTSSLSFDKSSGVSEMVVREALVCEMSPLGYHLSSSFIQFKKKKLEA